MIFIIIGTLIFGHAIICGIMNNNKQIEKKEYIDEFLLIISKERVSRSQEEFNEWLKEQDFYNTEWFQDFITHVNNLKDNSFINTETNNHGK